MLHEKRYYIFLDFPKGEALRETGISLHKDKKNILNLDEDEVKRILKNSLRMKNWMFYLSGRLEAVNGLSL